MTEETIKIINDDLLNRIKLICKELVPHVDTVQIFITKHESSEIGTTQMSWGEGNFFARYGQISQWLINEDSQTEDE